jgi:DNA polymerase III epsilon subunit-like protein
MLFVGFDCETTGLDVKKDRITEVGAVLWCTERNAPLKVFSSYMYEKTYPEISKEITELTGITQRDLDLYGRYPEQVLSDLLMFFDEGDFVLAHNGTNFDRPILESEMERVGAMYKDDVAWIDTSVDLPFPKGITTRKLSYLATEHGFLNPFPHRALFDVMTMLKVVSMYDTDEVVKLSKSPNLTIRAVVDYDNRKLASERGYRWNAENKMWVKTIKELNLETETKDVPFKVLIIQEK